MILYPQADMSRHTPGQPDPRLVRWLRRWLVLGLVAIALVPAARGSLPGIGWAPLWLVGMPLSAWWALHRFPLPRWPRQRRAAGAVPRRRRGMQARRRTRLPGGGLARAA